MIDYTKPLKHHYRPKKGWLNDPNGLIYLDGYYYYVRTSGQLAQNCDYWPTKHNGLIKVTRRYTFDDQGRMVDPPV